MKTRNLIATLVLTTFLAGSIQADNFTTQAKGAWNHSSNWVSGKIPAGDSKDPVVQINHDITLDGSINFSKNNPNFSLGSNVTFLVTQNLEFKNKLVLNIPAGSMMVIIGDFTVHNGMSAQINGDLVVLGDFFAKNNTDVNINGEGNMVVVGEYEVGNGNFNGSGSLYVLDNDPKCKTANGCGGNIANYYTSIEDLQNHNPGLYDIVNSGALPIQLLYFKGAALNEVSQLKWATEMEENFDYFVIERSVDGRTFESIGEVKGAGWSHEQRTYDFTDNNPANGVNYYRLKAVDFDGYTEYFNVISTYIEQAKMEISARVSHRILTVAVNASAHIRIINLQGAPVFEGAIETGRNSLTLPENILRGVYVAVIYNEAGVIGKEKIFIE